MRKKVELRECDICGKSVEQPEEILIGGKGAFAGWYQVEKEFGGVGGWRFGPNQKWDICSAECLHKINNQVRA